MTQAAIPNAKFSLTHEDVRELASRDDEAALELLAKVAESGDEFLRRSGVESIGRHKQGRSLEHVVLKALRDLSGYVVRTTCEVVADWEFSEAHDLVSALLTSTSGSTRQSALRALGAIWHDTDFPTVFRVHRTDSAASVRREAARVLRKRARSENWRTLFAAFHVDELARHRQWACELAETFSGPETLPLLSQLSLDPDGHVRKAASRAIETISTREKNARI